MAERKIDCFYSCTIQEVCKIPIEGGQMHLLDLDFAHLKSLSRILCKPPKYFPVSDEVVN